MAEPPALRRRRELRLTISGSTDSRDHLTAYLAQVDRPLTALLARERLYPQNPGHFLYRSNPYQILRWQVAPTVALVATWHNNQLEVRSTRCFLAGAGEWGESLGFSLMAVLQGEPAGLSGWAEAGLNSHVVNSQIARGLAARAMEAVLDRIERRVQRGLRKDLETWLLQAGETATEGDL
jgi:hypothetical protein